MGVIDKTPLFRFWCQKVLPLVYDDSLSYYELLCKVVDYLNHVIEDNNAIIDELDELKQELAVVQTWIDNFEYSTIENIIKDTIKMVFFGLTDTGYFVAYIPDSWEDITFNTTDYDYPDPTNVGYGHLVLSY